MWLPSPSWLECGDELKSHSRHLWHSVDLRRLYRRLFRSVDMCVCLSLYLSVCRYVCLSVRPLFCPSAFWLVIKIYHNRLSSLNFTSLASLRSRSIFVARNCSPPPPPPPPLLPLFPPPVSPLYLVLSFFILSVIKPCSSSLHLILHLIFSSNIGPGLSNRAAQLFMQPCSASIHLTLLLNSSSGPTPQLFIYNIASGRFILSYSLTSLTLLFIPTPNHAPQLTLPLLILSQLHLMSSPIHPHISI